MGAEVELAGALIERAGHGQELLRQGKTHLDQILRELVEVARGASPAPAGEALPQPPDSYSLTAQQVAAADEALRAVGTTKVNKRRKLTEPERTTLMRERLALSDLVKSLSAALEANRLLLAIHHDLVVEADRVERGYEVDDRGHTVAPDRVTAPGTGQDFSFEVTQGKAVVNAGLVNKLYRDGVLTDEQYESITVPVPPPPTPRVFDHERLSQAVLGDKDLLVLVAREATTKSPDKLFLHMRKAMH